MIRTVHLGLSYKCNCKCPHCYVSKKTDSLNKEIYKEIIAMLAKQGLMVIFYTYGEPLLSDDLYEVVKYANSLGLSQTLLTNGWFLNDKKIAELSEAGINSYNISIDSANAVKHDSNRKCEGLFDHALSAIRYLVKTEHIVGIGTTVTQKNKNEIIDIRDLAIKENVNHISFLMERQGNQLVDNRSSQYMSIFSDAILKKETRIRCFFHDPGMLPYINELHKCREISDDVYTRWSEMNSCHTHSSISIEPNGDVHRCNLCSSKLGTIKTMDDIKLINEWIKGDKHEYTFCGSLFS